MCKVGVGLPNSAASQNTGGDDDIFVKSAPGIHLSDPPSLQSLTASGYCTWASGIPPRRDSKVHVAELGVGKIRGQPTSKKPTEQEQSSMVSADLNWLGVCLRDRVVDYYSHGPVTR